MLAEEPDAAQQFADAPGEFFYRNDGGYDSEGPTEDTTFTLTEPTMITGIWTYHWYAANYDIDFSKQTIQLKDTATDTVVYSGAVRVGHIWNERDCDWIVLPNIVLPAGTYQVIDSHNESWCALNSKGVCMIKGYPTTPSATADFSTDPTAALSLLNAAKTGTTDSTWDSDTKTLTLNGVDFTTTAATAVRLPDDAKIVLNGENTITGGNSDSGDCYGIEGLGNLTIQGTGTLNVTGGTTSRTAYDSFGIRAYAVTIKSGTVIAKGGTAQMTEGSMSGGIDVSDITIEGGIVEATGGAAWRSCGFNIVALGNMYISGGAVTATGGTSDHYSYGIYTNYSAYVHITGGSLIAKAESAPSAKALPWAPDTLPDIYWWRSSDSGQYKKGSFNWDDVSTYVEIGDTEPITTYTVTFDANGGTGTMEDITGVSGTYTLPENGFTAPEGKQFKAWSVNGTEKAVGDKIAVSADTTVKAVWENIPAAPTEYNILDGANSSWTQDSDGNLSVRGSGAFSEFVGVKVDGKLVDEKYYTVKEGSTIVTLKADYLNTCTVGSHTLEIIWTDGSASTAFTVSAQTVVEPPQTGDNSMMWIWIALLVVSGIGVMGTIIYIRKKKHSGK